MNKTNLNDIQRVVEVATRVSGDEEAATRWLQEPLPVFGDRTPKDLIAEGRTEDLVRYLNSLEVGPLG